MEISYVVSITLAVALISWFAGIVMGASDDIREGVLEECEYLKSPFSDVYSARVSLKDAKENKEINMVVYYPKSNPVKLNKYLGLWITIQHDSTGNLHKVKTQDKQMVYRDKS